MNHRIWLIGCIATIAVAAASPAHAVVVPFDINPDVPVQPAGVIPGGNNIGSPFTYYNIQFVIDGGAADINIRTARADAVGGPGVDQVVSDGFNGSSIVTKGDNSFLNTPFAVGEVIGDGVNEFQRAADQFSVLQDAAQTAYAAGANYLGFRLTSGNYGFVKVNYDPASSTFTFLDGAYQNSGGPIVAGVPEPASAALLGLACVAGLAAIRRRRLG
jgi:hypothetical protein